MRASKVLAGAAAGAALAAATLPGRPARPVPALSAQPVTVVGHRGARGHAPENTLVGLTRGLELGSDALELDVRLSADGHVVVIHDPTVDRTTDGSGPVADHTLAELRRLDAGYRWRDADGYPFRARGLVVPTLEEVLAELQETFLVIELKAEAGLALAGRVVDVLREAKREDSVVVASGDRALIELVRIAAPDVPTNLSEPEARRLYGLHLTGLHRRWRGAGRVLQIPEVHEGRRVVTPRLVAAAHDLGLDVQVWTVNSPEDMRRLIDWGVDGLITDFPDRAVDVVAAAGLSARPWGSD